MPKARHISKKRKKNSHKRNTQSQFRKQRFLYEIKEKVENTLKPISKADINLIWMKI